MPQPVCQSAFFALLKNIRGLWVLLLVGKQRSFFSLLFRAKLLLILWIFIVCRVTIRLWVNAPCFDC